MDDIADKLQKEILNGIKKRYSAVFIEHWQNPRNWGIMDGADGYGKITGPCGDTIEIALMVRDGVVDKCTFDSDGCGTTVACASIVTDMVTGRTIIGARRVTESAIVDHCGGLPDEDLHCALLAAKTLHKALDDYEEKKKEVWKKYYSK